MLLLDAPEFGKPSGLVLLTVASPGHRKLWCQDIDRRVLQVNVAEEVGELGLTTCVGAESPIRPDSLQRAAAFGLLGVVDAEGLEDGAEGEENSRGNVR